MAEQDNPASHSHPTGSSRRQFLQQSVAMGAAAALAQGPAQAILAQVAPTAAVEPVPRRALGRTGLQVSVMGLGGYSLGDAPTSDEAKRIVDVAIDAGINFFDNAWEYHDGKSEQWLGEALKGKRDQVILMSKVCTHGRAADVALTQLDDSLRRLRTDHLDIWQIHEVIYWNDPDLVYAKGGVLDALDRAKRLGKVRFVGFTGHKDPRIHMRMLFKDYPFDTVQMPLNPFDATYRSFEKTVLPEAIRRGIAVLGMKSLCGGGDAVFNMPIRVDEALRYAMSLPAATTISGVDSLEVLHQNLAVARGFRPLSNQEMDAIRQRCVLAAGDGHLEMYKSTMKFDGQIGRQQHGFPPAKELPL